MNLTARVMFLALVGMMSAVASAQTKDPELNKCIQNYERVEQELEKLEQKLNEKQKKTVSDRRIKAVKTYQSVRPRTLQSCRTYLGTIGTIKNDITYKRL